MQIVVAALGWLGAASSLAAYYLVSQKVIAPDSLKYHGLNMGGAILLALACAWTSAWPSFFTNLIFLAIGVKMVITTKRAVMKHLMRRAGHQVALAPVRVGHGIVAGSRRVTANGRRIVAAIPHRLHGHGGSLSQQSLDRVEARAERVEAKAEALGLGALEATVHPVTGMIFLVEREECAGEVDAQRAGAVIESQIDGAVAVSQELPDAAMETNPLATATAVAHESANVFSGKSRHRHARTEGRLAKRLFALPQRMERSVWGHRPAAHAQLNSDVGVPGLAAVGSTGYGTRQGWL